MIACVIFTTQCRVMIAYVFVSKPLFCLVCTVHLPSIKLLYVEHNEVHTTGGAAPFATPSYGEQFFFLDCLESVCTCLSWDLILSRRKAGQLVE